MSDKDSLIHMFDTNPGAYHDDPVTNEALDEAEKNLQIQIPSSFRDFLLNFGAARYQGLDIFGLPNNRLNKFRNFVEETQAYRAIPPNHRNPADHLISVADNTGGFFLYLDTSQTDGHGDCVAVQQGGDGTLELYADNFYAAIARYINHMLETEIQPDAHQLAKDDERNSQIAGIDDELLWLQLAPAPDSQEAHRSVHYFALNTVSREVFIHASLTDLDAEDQVRVMANGKGFFADPAEVGGFQDLYLSIGQILAEFPSLDKRAYLLQLQAMVRDAYDNQ